MIDDHLVKTFKAAITSAMAERDPLLRNALLTSLESSVEDDDELMTIFNTTVELHSNQVSTDNTLG